MVPGEVTWDGSCTTSGSNSYATLSNGWMPYFTGPSACVLALQESAGCANAGTACATRVSYGPTWLPPPNHPTSYDDVAGRVFSDGTCQASGADSVAVLSNGWTPTFQGSDACALSFRYTQCGGLYQNPVIPTDCPDPGVIFDGTQYVLTCTSGNAADAFPIYTSPDLVTWTLQGHIFPSGQWPPWAQSNFWAAEIHRVGSQYIAYYSASDAAGVHRVGAASAPASTGPFTDLGAPLVENATEGVIDPTEFTDVNGTPYVLWKVDGNANGMSTPIFGQQLSPDGLGLLGTPTQLITNDLPWEGAVTEAPYLVLQGGTYFLFYSGNSYATTSYAVGVASAPSPLGPYLKNQRPILVTEGAWAGPGHCAVVETPAGDSYMVYHAWVSGCVNGPGCGREVLVDALLWGGAYPSVPLAPSSNTRPLP